MDKDRSALKGLAVERALKCVLRARDSLVSMSVEILTNDNTAAANTTLSNSLASNMSKDLYEAERLLSAIKAAP